MWTKIIGHKPQIESLKRTLAGGRLPNAWIFSGIRGIGKRRTAGILSAAITCGAENPPCGVCVSCKKVVNGIHPDVIVIEPEKQNIVAEQVRDLNQRVRMHALEALAKVAIIDEAECMTETAANSMLKTLEEPPPNTHFILITKALHRMLPTIRSRCQKLAFSPLDETTIASYLKDVEGFEQGHAEKAAHLSLGSLGLARELTPEFIDEVLGKFEAVSERASAADIISTSEVWSEDADRSVLILELLAGWFRDKLRKMSDSGVGETKKILVCLDKVMEARNSSETTANKQLMFEQLLFSVAGSNIASVR